MAHHRESRVGVVGWGSRGNANKYGRGTATGQVCKLVCWGVLLLSEAECKGLIGTATQLRSLLILHSALVGLPMCFRVKSQRSNVATADA